MHVVVDPWMVPHITLLPPFTFDWTLDGSVGAVRAFHVRPTGCPNHTSPWCEATSPRDLLFAAGLMTSSATNPNELSAWGFLVEHATSIAPNRGMLRVVDAARTWESRTKGLFSERLAMGVAALLLWRSFNVVHIADLAPFLGVAIQQRGSAFDRVSAQFLGLHGELRPDFICLTPQLEAVLAESKGAIGPPAAVKKVARDRAKRQLQNVAPRGVPLRQTEGRLTFASTFRAESETCRPAQDTGAAVVDPPDGDDVLSVPVTADDITIHAYSKVLNFVGLGRAGMFLRRGWRPLLREPSVPFEFAGERMVLLAQIGDLQLGMIQGVATGLLNGAYEGVAMRVQEELKQSPLARGEVDDVPGLRLALPNGLVLFSANP